MLKQFWDIKHLTWGMPTKNSEGRPNFREDIKLLIGLRLPKQPLLQLSPPPPTPHNFTFVISILDFFKVGKFDKYFLDGLIKKGFIWLVKTIQRCFWVS